MNAFTLTILFALLTLPVTAQQRPQQPTPSPIPASIPPELVAKARVALVDIRVSDVSGQPIERAEVSWRSTAGGGLARGQTRPDGRYLFFPGLTQPREGSWQFTPVGSHRFEITAAGFHPSSPSR